MRNWGRGSRLSIGSRRYLHHLSESGDYVARKLLVLDRRVGGSDVRVAESYILYSKSGNYDAAKRVISGRMR